MSCSVIESVLQYIYTIVDDLSTVTSSPSGRLMLQPLEQQLPLLFGADSATESGGPLLPALA